MDGPFEEIGPRRRDGDSLLKKYDIPVSHLDFPYVESCTNGRELEKILHVLRSGQEGHYPDLMRKTEERLAQVKPNSVYVRKSTPVLSRKFMDENELKDLNAWMTDVGKSSQELEKARRRSGSSNQPDVRKCKKSVSEPKRGNEAKRIQSTDYSSWDKYDPDTEILKMDIEAERMRKDAAQKEKETRKKEREVKFSEFTTRAEASFEANREREKGNECFKAGEYAQAITYYTNSINYMPSVNNYNNRAIARIKLRDYDQARSDCSAALKYEPNNIKALLRLVQCHESLGELEDGLRVSERIIQIDPNNTAAQNFVNKFKSQLNVKINVKTRMRIEESAQNEQPRLNEVSRKYRKTTEINKIKKDNKRDSTKISFNTVDTKAKQQQCEPDLSKRPIKSILKKKHVLLPIPGPSTMPEPYYVMVENKDPEIIKRQEYILNNRPQMICLNNIDAMMDENECLEVHIGSSREKEAKERKNKAKMMDLSESNKANLSETSVERGEHEGCFKKDAKNIENLSKSTRNEYSEMEDKKMLSCLPLTQQYSKDVKITERCNDEDVKLTGKYSNEGNIKITEPVNDEDAEGKNLNDETLPKIDVESRRLNEDMLPKTESNNECANVTRKPNLNEELFRKIVNNESIFTTTDQNLSAEMLPKIDQTSDNNIEVARSQCLNEVFRNIGKRRNLVEREKTSNKERGLGKGRNLNSEHENVCSFETVRKDTRMLHDGGDKRGFVQTDLKKENEFSSSSLKTTEKHGVNEEINRQTTITGSNSGHQISTDGSGALKQNSVQVAESADETLTAENQENLLQVEESAKETLTAKNQENSVREEKSDEETLTAENQENSLQVQESAKETLTAKNQENSLREEKKSDEETLTAENQENSLRAEKSDEETLTAVNQENSLRAEESANETLTAENQENSLRAEKSGEETLTAKNQENSLRAEESANETLTAENQENSLRAEKSAKETLTAKNQENSLQVEESAKETLTAENQENSLRAEKSDEETLTAENQENSLRAEKSDQETLTAKNQENSLQSSEGKAKNNLVLLQAENRSNRRSTIAGINDTLRTVADGSHPAEENLHRTEEISLQPKENLFPQYEERESNGSNEGHQSAIDAVKENLLQMKGPEITENAKKENNLREEITEYHLACAKKGNNLQDTIMGGGKSYETVTNGSGLSTENVPQAEDTPKTIENHPERFAKNETNKKNTFARINNTDGVDSSRGNLLWVKETSIEVEDTPKTTENHPECFVKNETSREDSIVRINDSGGRDSSGGSLLWVKGASTENVLQVEDTPKITENAKKGSSESHQTVINGGDSSPEKVEDGLEDAPKTAEDHPECFAKNETNREDSNVRINDTCGRDLSSEGNPLWMEGSSKKQGSKIITDGNHPSGGNVPRMEETTLVENLDDFQKKNASHKNETVPTLETTAQHSQHYLEVETGGLESSAKPEITLSAQENDLQNFQTANKVETNKQAISLSNVSESSAKPETILSAQENSGDGAKFETDCKGVVIEAKHLQHCAKERTNSTSTTSAGKFLEITNDEYFQSTNFGGGEKSETENATDNFNVATSREEKSTASLDSTFMVESNLTETVVENRTSSSNGMELLDDPQNIDHDANNNKGENYFTARKWNNARGRNGSRSTNEVNVENERNTNPTGGGAVVQNERQRVQARSEPHICRREMIDIEELHVPYSFLKMWNAVGRDSTYAKHAEVLRNLDYNRLPEVIGYKLDGTMLSAIVSTLHSHFMVPHEIDRVHQLLANMSGMRRFRIVSMFLSTADKSRVKSLCEFLQQHGNPLPEDVVRLYF